MARNYKNLEIWNLSYNLSLKFYKITEKFPEKENNNLTSQIRRATASIPSNIAEGCSRFTKKGFLQFLSYSYGSIKELEVLLMLAKDLKYIELKEYSELNEELDMLARKLFLFINKVEKEKFLNWFK